MRWFGVIDFTCFGNCNNDCQKKAFWEDTLKKQDFVVRFAGEGGQGVVTSAEGVAQAMAQS